MYIPPRYSSEGRKGKGLRALLPFVPRNFSITRFFTLRATQPNPVELFAFWSYPKFIDRDLFFLFGREQRGFCFLTPASRNLRPLVLAPSSRFYSGESRTIRFFLLQMRLKPPTSCAIDPRPWGSTGRK